MKSKIGLWIAAPLALLIGAGLLFNGFELRSASESQAQTLTRRFQRAVVSILQKAHSHNDDLMMQEVIQALGETSGISYAAVVNDQGQVMAHSQPSEIGSRFRYVPERGSSILPLKTGTSLWGHFVMNLPDPSARCLVARQLMVWSVEGIILGALLFILGWQGLRIYSTEEKKCQETAEILRAVEQKLSRSVADHQQAEQRWNAWLQESINRRGGAMVLLDHRQKLIGMNRAAAMAFKLENSDTFFGKSWQDVPCLRDCGQALEQSLAAPGKPIEWPSGDLRLTFETPAGGSAGTWISLG